MFNSKMVILTSSETNNHSNNVDFVTKKKVESAGGTDSGDGGAVFG